MRSISLALFVASLLFAPDAPAQEPFSSRLASAREQAFHEWLNDSVVQSTETLSSAIREEAARLVALAGNDETAISEEALGLAAEIEFSLIRLFEFANRTRNSQHVIDLLEGVEIPPQFGGAHARLATLRADCIEKLALLVDWQFVGPFDNERGAGMEVELPPMSDPGAEVYAGKVRPVSWRLTPDTAPRKGRLQFWQLLDPNTQACVFARSWIKSPEQATRLLQLGFEDEIRIWLNGTPIFEALGVHEARRDAFAIELDLAEGWNELSVLVGAREGAPSFVARLTETGTGRPLALEQSRVKPQELPLFRLASGSPSPDRRVAPGGARGLLGQGETAQDALVRSILEDHFRAAPGITRPGRESAQLAVDRDPQSLEARVQLAARLRESNRSEEQDVNAWLHAIDEVLKLSPDNPWAWRQKAYHAGWNQPTYQRALDNLERALATNPTSIPALDLKILLLEFLDQDSLANRLREGLLAHPQIDAWPSVASSCANSLSDPIPKRAELDLSWFEASGDADALRRWAWDESKKPGRNGVVIIADVLERRVARNPWSVSARLDAAQEYLTLGETELALDALAEAESIAPDSYAVQYWRARAYLRAGDTEKAISALERELELDFSAENERRLLEYIQNSEGRASFHEEYREALTDVIRRVQIDANAAALLPSREVILNRVVIKVHPDGTAHRYHRTIERILSEAGARDRDAIRFGSFPNQELRVLRADVLDIQGELRQARTGRSAGRMTVDMPPLKVGDVIDLEWRVDDVRQTFFGSYLGLNEVFTPDPSIPVHESEIIILSPDEFPLRFHTRGEVDDAIVDVPVEGVTRRTWQKKAILPLKPERFMPPAEESLAAVQATSYESWEAFGAWWWNLIEEEIQVSPEMSSKVEELTAGKESALEKLRAIYDFVVTDIRYNAWEFGVHGYQPYEAPVIFSRGFGDCKDKAILLRAMLGEVGIDAWPVLIRAEQRRPDEDQTLALVEHFNHCIAYIPAQDDVPEMFLDGTARHHPLEILPAMDNGADVLVVRSDGVEQRTIPVAAAEANSVSSEFEVQLNLEGGAQVKMTRKPEGRFDPADRGRFTGSEEQRKEAAQAILVALFGPIEGDVSTRFSDLDNLEEKVEIEFEASVKQVARPNEDGFELPAALSKFDLLRSLASEDERETDLLVDVPRSSTMVIRYKLPPGASPRDLPEDVHAESADASYDWSARQVEGGVEIREQFTLKTNRIKPADYAGFRDLSRKVDEAQNAMLDVEVKP